MCFSAKASFITSAFLFITWIACLAEASRAKSSRHALLVLTFIPFFFGIQQAAEGILWILLPKVALTPLEGTIPKEVIPWAITGATYLFIGLAAFCWPLLIPLGGYTMEPVPSRKNLFKLFILGALLWAVIGGYHLFTHGVTAVISTASMVHTTSPSSHILYTLKSPFFRYPIWRAYYCIAIIAPFFISSIPLFNLFGILTTLSYIAAYFFWYKHFLSVWCFFAAVISLLTYLVIRSITKKEESSIITSSGKGQ